MNSLGSALSNVFNLEVETIVWHHFSEDKKASTPLSLAQPNPEEDAFATLKRENPILGAYIQFLANGIPCVWTQTIDAVDPYSTMQPITGLSSSPSSQKISSFKELWVFEFGKFKFPVENFLASNPTILHLESGTCKLHELQSSKRTHLFFRALHNLLERVFIKHSFYRIGDRFLSSTKRFQSSPEFLPSFSFSFFIHGSKLYFNVVVRSCRLEHFHPSSTPDAGKDVLVTSPYSLVASFRPSNSDLLQRSKQMEEEWKSLIGIESKNLVSLVIDGSVFYYPSACIFRLKELQLPSRMFFHEVIRRELGLKSNDFGAFSRLLMIERENATDPLWAWKYLEPFQISSSSTSSVIDQSPGIEQPFSSPITPRVEESKAHERPAPEAQFSLLHNEGEQKVMHQPNALKRKPSRENFLEPPPKRVRDEETLDHAELDQQAVEEWITLYDKKPQFMEDEEEEVVASSTPSNDLFGFPSDQMQRSLFGSQTVPSNQPTQVQAPQPQMPSAQQLLLQQQILKHQRQQEALVESEKSKVSVWITSEMIPLPAKKYTCPPSYMPVNLRTSSSTAISKFTLSYTPSALGGSGSNGIATTSSPLAYTPSPATPGKASPETETINTAEHKSALISNISEDEDMKEAGSPAELTPQEGMLPDRQAELSPSQLVKNVVHQNQYHSALANVFLSALQETKTVSALESNEARKVSSKLSGNLSSSQHKSSQSPAVYSIYNDPFVDLARQLALYPLDTLPFVEAVDGIHTKLSVQHCTAIRKRFREQTTDFDFPFQSLNQLASTEEPNSDAIEMALDPLGLPSSHTTVLQILQEIKPALHDLFGQTQVEGPLNLRSWSAHPAHYESAFLEELSMPDYLVGYQDEWLRLTGSSLRLWDKIRLEPFAPKKNINYYALCPNNLSILHETKEFLKELSSIYDACNFGTHIPSNYQTQGIIPVALVENTHQYEQECKKLADHLIETSLTYTESSAFVIYAIDPFTLEGEVFPNREVVRCLTSLMERIQGRNNLNVAFQIVPLQFIFQHSQMALVLKEIAFSVFNKIRRITIDEEKSIQQRQLFEPAYILVSSLPPAERVLHCSYMFSDDESYLVAAITDDRGELIETLVLPHYEEQPTLKLLEKIWHHSVSIMSSLPEIQWKLVIEKFGELSNREIEGWKSICQKGNFLPMHKIFLLTIEFCRSLQIIAQLEKSSNSYAFFPQWHDSVSSSSHLYPKTVSYILTAQPTTSAHYSPFTPPLVPNQIAQKISFWLLTDVHNLQNDFVDNARKWITRQLHDLSWLTASPQFPERQTSLPFHIAILKRLSRLVSWTESTST